MNINSLKTDNRPFSLDGKGEKAYQQLQVIIDELNTKQLPPTVIERINYTIDLLYAPDVDASSIGALLVKTERELIAMVEKETKLVPKDYYRKLWASRGMITFGLPIGLAIGLISGNLALLAVGFPFGIAFGFAVGTIMDRKVKRENRQYLIHDHR